jgi:flavodoxin
VVTILLMIIFLLPWYSFGKENTVGKTLIIYYSRTGKTKLICETLQKNLNADLLEIKDPKDRSGSWGFITSAIDAFLHKHTPIEPEHPDLSAYSFIIVASPIWSWNLSTPIHTLFEKNRFDGKKLILVTTANIHIMKYEQYGDNASFIKRFLRDYLRGKRAVAVSEVSNAGGEFVGHYHFETKEKNDSQITEDTLKIVSDVQKKILK